MVMILLAASKFMGVVFSSLGTPSFIARTLLSFNLPNWVFRDIYKGMMPFMGLQSIGVTLVYFFQPLSLWLPSVLF